MRAPSPEQRDRRWEPIAPGGTEAVWEVNAQGRGYSAGGVCSEMGAPLPLLRAEKPSSRESGQAWP